MEKENKLTEIMEVLSSETKVGILFSLQFYDALNLKQIAQIAGIKEPSAFEHIKGRGNEEGLLGLGLIKEDKSQQGRGKYYQLTRKGNQLFASINAGIKAQKDNTSINNEIAELSSFDNTDNLQIITKFFSSIAIIAKNFATHTANYILQQISEGEKFIQDKLKDQLYINFSYLDIKTNEQRTRLNEVFTQFGKVIHEISEESKKLKESEIDDKFFIYTFSSSLNLIDPRNV